MTATWHNSPLMRKAMFAGGNLLAVVAIVMLVILPLNDLFAARDAEIARQADLLAHAQAIAGHETDVQRIVQQSADDMKRGEFLSGANEGVASANLQARLQAMSESSGAKLRSVQGLPAKSQGAARYLGVRLQIYGPIQAIHRATYAIETAKPYLQVGDATIKLSTLTGKPDASAEQVIEAQFDVFAAFQLDEHK